MILQRDGDYLNFYFYGSTNLENTARKDLPSKFMPLAMADVVFYFDLQTMRFGLKKWRYGDKGDTHEWITAVKRQFDIDINDQGEFVNKQEEILFLLKYR